MILALLLATSPCDNAQTQLDLNECWANQAKVADAALNKTYEKVLNWMGKADRPRLVKAELAWISARDKTCAFEVSLVEGGSIAPQEEWMCVDRMTRARTARLQSFYDTSNAGDDILKPSPVSPQVDAELNHVYGSLSKALSASQRAQLVSAEVAWIAYRDAACSLEGNACLTDLERERTAELKAGWLGDPVW